VDNPYISIQHLSKSFHTEHGRVNVLNDINLDIAKGEIFGIMGFSGAGKSTLVRCINRLEEPDGGKILINNQNILELNHAELNKRREKIGMIFQTFNLFDSKTVYKNIEMPLKSTVRDKNDRRSCVEELGKLVGLKDKLYQYPSQLSGGQKQRVGIARALANHPDVLLSDEATSALDPQTTINVLDLLKDINERLGVTMILITHETEVIKYACDEAAIIESGRIQESGNVIDLFRSPESDTGKIFARVENDMSKAWEERFKS
jgi:D-methionine transport system ATP-binding protein